LYALLERCDKARFADARFAGIGIPLKAFVPNANLDAALERLKQGVFGIAGAKRGGCG
jgi:hypothetical protein